MPHANGQRPSIALLLSLIAASSVNAADAPAAPLSAVKAQPVAILPITGSAKPPRMQDFVRAQSRGARDLGTRDRESILRRRVAEKANVLEAVPPKVSPGALAGALDKVAAETSSKVTTKPPGVSGTSSGLKQLKTGSVYVEFGPKTPIVAGKGMLQWGGLGSFDAQWNWAAGLLDDRPWVVVSVSAQPQHSYLAECTVQIDSPGVQALAEYTVGSEGEKSQLEPTDGSHYLLFVPPSNGGWHTATLAFRRKDAGGAKTDDSMPLVMFRGCTVREVIAGGT